MLINKVYGLLGLCARAGKIVSGMDAVSDDLKRNKIKLIIIAEDASNKTFENIKFLADKKKVTVIKLGTIIENSKAIGKENKAIIGIKDKNISEGIKKIIFGGEAFGEN